MTKHFSWLIFEPLLYYLVVLPVCGWPVRLLIAFLSEMKYYSFLL